MKTKHILIFAVILSFFVFQLFLFVKSFPAEYNLYLRYLERLKTSDPFWTSFWFFSELIGEVGLIIRFIGSCFALAFGWILIQKKIFSISFLRKAVLCEGLYYVLNFPFIISLYARPETSIVNLEAGTSYLLQIIFVAFPFLVLYNKLREQNSKNMQDYKWFGLSIVGFTFGLWVKHFLMNIYALPISLTDPILLAGFLNSTLTILFAGLVLIFTFFPIIRQKTLKFNSKLVGVGFLFIGLYFIIYLLISFRNQSYSNFLILTEFWAIAFVIPGIGYILSKRTGRNQWLLKRIQNKQK